MSKLQSCCLRGKRLEGIWSKLLKKEYQYFVIYTDSSFKNIERIEEYPNIKNHLDKFKEVITSDNKPYWLHRARDEKFFKWGKNIILKKSS